MSIGERTAEQIKCSIGMAYPSDEVLTMTIKGRDQAAGLPRTQEVNSDEIRDALNEPIRQIVQGVRTALEHTPPELAADIIDKGIVLTGGGALLRGLSTRLQEKIHIPVHVAEEPLLCVAKGAGIALNNVNRFSFLMR
jgi:rod shape-determining protein MreB